MQRLGIARLFPSARIGARLGLAVLIASTGACEPSSQDDDDTASSEAATSEAATTGTPEDPFEELIQCDDSDFAASPFMGPAFDPETGELLAPLEPPYVVATTLGWPKPDPAAYEALGEHSDKATTDVLTREGLLGASFGGSQACGSAATLSIWVDEASLRAFVFGEVHRAAMGVVPTAMQAWATTRWTETSATTPPTWEQARAKLLEAREARAR